MIEAHQRAVDRRCIDRVRRDRWRDSRRRLADALLPVDPRAVTVALTSAIGPGFFWLPPVSQANDGTGMSRIQHVNGELGTIRE